MSDSVTPTPEVPKEEGTTFDPVKLKKYAMSLAQWGMLVAAMLVATILGTLTVRWLGDDKQIVIPPPPPIPQEDKASQEGELFICGRVEHYSEAINTRPWPVKKLPWTLKPYIGQNGGYRGSLSAYQLKEAFSVAWASWAAYIDIDPVYTDDDKSALIVSRFGSIDGSGRVLAWSELADGTTTPKEQLYDSGENWEIAAKPTQIDLVRVAAHEIGHVLGLLHDDDNSGALMAPIYSRTVRFPTARDIKRLLLLGYKEKKMPDGVPTIPPLNLTIDSLQVIKELERMGFKVEKK